MQKKCANELVMMMWCGGDVRAVAGLGWGVTSVGVEENPGQVII
jgi:hypothetical protein